jgi:AraC family transcriptional regulator
MQEHIEREVSVPGASVVIGTSQWTQPVEWACPESRYVVCQRLSEGHSSLRLGQGPGLQRSGVREVYGRVRSLGFMPSRSSIMMHPLGQPLRTLNCWFDRDYFETATEIDVQGWSDRAGSFLSVANSTVGAMMRRINAELARPGFGSEQAIEAASTIIAVEMARLGRSRIAAEKADRSLAPWQLRRIRERIEASPGQGYPTVQDLAELCGLSRSHLMRTFKATTGHSVHEFITEQRLSMARRLLAEDRLSMKEVAARLGFSSPSHFTNTFQRQEFMTPSQYRRLGKAGPSLSH